MKCFYWFIFSSYTYWNCLFFSCLLILGGLKGKKLFKNKHADY